MNAVRSLLDKTHNGEYTWLLTISEDDVQRQGCANATCISIATALTDALLIRIAQDCKQVKTLDMYLYSKYVLSNYTSAGFYAVIENCPRLRTICIRENLDMPHLNEVIRRHPELFVRSFANSYDVMKMN